MPLTDAYVGRERLADPEQRYPLEVGFCSNCSLVQLLHSVPPGEMFVDYSYYSSISRTLLAHSRAHAEQLVESRRLGPDSLVVEIASNDGYLLQYFANAGIPVLGIDPAIGPARAAQALGIPTLQEFFTSELAARLRAEGRQADVLLANNVLAHVPDPNDFVAGIAILLRDDGIAEVEAPYMKDLIDNLEFDTIYHEHVSYFSVTAAKRLFDRHGLSLNHLRHFPIHGGTFRFTLARMEEVSQAVRALLVEDEAAGLTSFEYFRHFGERVAELQERLRTLLGRLKDAGNRIAAYGAAAKGTILLNSSGIGADVIDYVADKSPHKHGLHLPGVGIPIVPVERLRDDFPDYLLLLAWNFRDEIVEEQRAYLDAGGRFIVPVPTPVIFGAEALGQLTNGSMSSR